MAVRCWGTCVLITLLALLRPALSNDSSRALLYLVKYGYADHGNSSALLTEQGIDTYIKSAVKDFQAFAGLTQTGELDKLTLELMATPRCGVKDIIGHGATARRKKRYVLQGSRWRVTELTYRISKYPSTNRLTKAEVDDQVKKAFAFWSDVTALTFTPLSAGTALVDIRFERGEHGDGDPFDGPGGTLAHAYFPQYGGDVHVDDTEYWTINSYTGTNLLQTITHELGHSLGLSHSDVQGAIMAPFYRGWDPNLKLSKDDIQAIQALYGENVPKPTPVPGSTEATTTVAGGGGGDSLCLDSSFDAIFRTKDSTTYVFRGDMFWKLTKESVAGGYPLKISSVWSGLPDNINAGFTLPTTGETYIFRGGDYWKFTNTVAEPGYPRTMAEGFPGIPTSVDAAFVWSGNGKIYFFKGAQYWKFDPNNLDSIRNGIYPKPVALWSLPANIDGALQWDNGKTYFFKDGRYWRFYDIKFQIDRANPAFPRNTGEWWFGCPKANLKALKVAGSEDDDGEEWGEEIIDQNEIGPDYYETEGAGLEDLAATTD